MSSFEWIRSGVDPADRMARLYLIALTVIAPVAVLVAWVLSRA